MSTYSIMRSLRLASRVPLASLATHEKDATRAAVAATHGVTWRQGERGARRARRAGRAGAARGARGFGSEKRAETVRQLSRGRNFTVREILGQSPPKVNTVALGTTLREAVQQMVREDVGSLMVVSEKGRLAGILTERDYLRATGGEGPLNPANHEQVVDAIMTPADRVVTVTADTTVAFCVFLMAEHQFRHLPVLAGHDLVGMVGSRQLLSRFVDYHEVQVEHLQSFIPFPVW